jgi:heterodisulfide reductase subunit C
LRPDGRFMAEADPAGGVGLAACYGCKKCSNGCPLTFAMDLHPYQVVRLAQLGQVERLKDCRTIWVCSACQTCFTRCPNEVDLPRFMDWLKEKVAKEGRTVEQKRTLLFHRQFLKEIARNGRVFEGSLMAGYMIKSGGAFGPEAMKNARLGLAMLIRGRLKLTPSIIKDRRWLKALFKGRKV